MTDFRSWLQYVKTVVDWCHQHPDGASIVIVGLMIVGVGAYNLNPLVMVTGVGIICYGLYHAYYVESLKDNDDGGGTE